MHQPDYSQVLIDAMTAVVAGLFLCWHQDRFLLPMAKLIDRWLKGKKRKVKR